MSQKENVRELTKRLLLLSDRSIAGIRSHSLWSIQGICMQDISQFGGEHNECVFNIERNETEIGVLARLQFFPGANYLGKI